MIASVATFRRRCICVLIWSLMAAAPAWGQLAPRVGYAYPAGGQRGTTITISIGGQWLEQASAVMITGQGVNAEVIEFVESDLQKLARLRSEANQLEGRQQRNQEGDASDRPKRDRDDPANAELRRLRKEIREITRRVFDPKYQINPQIGETLRVRLTIAADATVGRRELRVVTPQGVSNPLTFHVGSLPEVNEGSPPPELPVVFNGQILPGEVDAYPISARRGQRLVFMADARGLMPYLADAVPGWFQAVLTLNGPDGKEVAYVDDYAFSPDPVLLYEVPADGTYTLTIRDAIYRGRVDFVYRITAGELPFVTSVFPLGGPSDETTKAAVAGWNLPSQFVEVSPSEELPDVIRLVVKAAGGMSNGVPFAVSDSTEIAESEPDGDPLSVQTVRLPGVANGLIDSPGDWDGYAFEGKAGQRIVADVHARRLGSPLDAVLRLTDLDGNLLATNDDTVDPAAGLVTHHADSHLQAVLPSDGLYLIRIGDVQGHGSSRHAYRLDIGPPRPDFAVRVVPSSVHVLRGGSVPVTVHVLRADGFDGPVRLELGEGGEGLSLSGVVPAGADSACLTLSADRQIDKGVRPVKLTATAIIDGQRVRRDAVAAEDMMQAFLYRHLVPAQQFVVSVGNRARVSITAVEPDGGVLRIPAGGSGKLVVEANHRARRNVDRIRFDLVGAPDGVTLEDGTISAGRQVFPLVILADAEQVQTGQRGNLVISLVAGRRQVFRVCCTAAIPFEIVD